MNPGLLAVLLLVARPLGVYAGNSKTSSTSLNVYIFNEVVDEQDTNDFYGKPTQSTQFCPGVPSIYTQLPKLLGDQAVLNTLNIYNFPLSTALPWSSTTDTATLYSDGADAGSNPVAATLNAGGKIVSLATTGTLLNGSPRKLKVDFSKACNGCGNDGDPSIFPEPVTKPMLLNLALTSSYTAMAVCSTVICTEAHNGYARLWFDDATDPNVTWRVNWAHVRMLRMSLDTWYIIADRCDGTDIAGLSKLTGNRQNPREVFNGYFLIPFFIQATLK